MDDFTLNFWHWLSLAFILLVIELLSGTVFFLWLSVACVGVAGVVAYSPELIWQYQLAWSAGFMLLGTLLWKYAGRWITLPSPSGPGLNRRAEQYVGRVFTLSDGIVNGMGKIKVDDSMWRVSGEDMPAGTRVKVTAAAGMILQVVKEP